MYYFLSKCWRCSKLLVATTLTAASSGTVIYGSVVAAASTAPIVIALGSIGLVGSAVLFFESCRVQADILKAIQKNEQLIADFKQENSAFHSENAVLQQSVRTLESSLKSSAIQVEKLTSLRQELTAQLENHQKQFADEKLYFEQRSAQEQAQFRVQLQSLIATKDQFALENQNLQQALALAQEQTGKLEQLYQSELARDAANQAQIAKLKLIVESMQQLLTAVTSQGEHFDNFEQTLDQRLQEMDKQNNQLVNAVEMMDSLLHDMTNRKFEELDVNADGVVDKIEFYKQW